MTGERVAQELAAHRRIALVTNAPRPLGLGKEHGFARHAAIVGGGIDARGRGSPLDDFRIRIGIMISRADDPLAPPHGAQVIGEFPRLGGLLNLLRRVHALARDDIIVDHEREVLGGRHAIAQTVRLER